MSLWPEHDCGRHNNKRKNKVSSDPAEYAFEKLHCFKIRKQFYLYLKKKKRKEECIAKKSMIFPRERRTMLHLSSQERRLHQYGVSTGSFSNFSISSEMSSAFVSREPRPKTTFLIFASSPRALISRASAEN